ncbi:MAG: hypothetical protein LUQ36_08330, partial [Methanoregula sp.]|nr:hypothetical protein [Methanoregula sp.]
IDFPKSHHSVQKNDIADIHANILTLSYPWESIEEIRLHHVFEHFQRPTACALIAGWNSWLRNDGILHIEVPDLKRMSLNIFNPFSSIRTRSRAERHVFGSHEADWATHYEGYDARMLLFLLKSFGFEKNTLIKNSWRGTHNIEVLVRKVRSFTKEESHMVAQQILRNYLVDDSEIEQNLLLVWMKQYDEQVSVTYSNKGS